jgi:hypothetical protein
MSDDNLRSLERRWLETDAPDDEGRLLTARVRAGQLSNRALLRAALFGSPSARLAVGDSHQGDTEYLSQEEMDEVLRLVFRGVDVPERTRAFLNNIDQQDREARATLNHYELVQEGDKEPPDSATALKALMDDLREHSSHREAIAQMQNPTLQLIPVYTPEGPSFFRLINAIDAHRREGQYETSVSNHLLARWRAYSDVPGKITGWQVAVTEGAKDLPRESNRFLERNGQVQRAEDQLYQWQFYCQEHELELCDNRSYALLQMQEIRQAAQVTLYGMGIDQGNETILKDLTRGPNSDLTIGSWASSHVQIAELHRDSRYDNFRFRPAVVVKKIL